MGTNPPAQILDGSDLPNLEFLPKYKDGKETTQISHQYDYCGRNSIHVKNHSFRKANTRTESEEMVIYTKPGRARPLELVSAVKDDRAGKLPQHNTPGSFHPDLEIRPTRDIFIIKKKVYHIDNLPNFGYSPHSVVMTQKKLHEIYEQFANLNFVAFKHMLGIDLAKDKDKRDFTVWVRKESPLEHSYICVDKDSGYATFMQIVKKDQAGKVINVIYSPFHMGEAMVMTESYIDSSGRLRNIVHIGVAGAAAESNTETDRRSGVERFDDGTMMWVLSSYKGSKCTTGAAALKPDGSIVIMSKSLNKKLAQNAARSFGGEQILPSTQTWTGRFSLEACVPVSEDKFVIRTEYKTAVRRQTSALVDGSCIPGLRPIFDVKL
jgi:hypothetical protein